MSIINQYNHKDNYNIREKNKYADFLDDLSEAKFPIYVVSGNPYWKSYIEDSLISKLGTPVKVFDNLQPHLDRMEVKTLKRKRHFIIYENGNRKMKENDFIAIARYLRNPSKNGVLVLFIKDWVEKKMYLTSFKQIVKDESIKFYDLDFPSDVFKSLHIQDIFQNNGIRFTDKKVLGVAVKQLGYNMDDFKKNIDTLKSFEGKEISDMDFSTHIDKYLITDLDRFYESLALLNRKKLPYQTLQTLISQGKTPTQILKGIERYFLLLYQAKLLRMKGLLREGDIEFEKKKYFDETTIKFYGVNIWEVSKKLRKTLLEVAKEIALKDILFILNTIESTYEVITYRKDEEVKYYKSANELQLTKLLIDILNRRVDEDEDEE